MKNFKTAVLLFLSILIMLQSCTIEKRHYRPGYNVEWKHKTPALVKHEKEDEEESAEEIIPGESSLLNKPMNDEIENDESSAGVYVEHVRTKVEQVFQPNEKYTGGNDCDRIYLVNGKIIKCRITTTKDALIIYTDCDSVGANEQILDKKQVKAVKYANGDYKVLNIIENGNDCDRIYLKNGSVFQVKIISTKDSTVKYKLCQNNQGNEIVLNKKTLKGVKFANGDQYVYDPNLSGDFSLERKNEQHKQHRKMSTDRSRKPGTWMGLAAILLGLIAFIALLAGSFICLAFYAFSIALSIAGLIISTTNSDTTGTILNILCLVLCIASCLIGFLALLIGL